MKKQLLIAATLCVAFAFTGCKSKESEYRKAYDKALANETVVEQQPTTVVPVTPPVVQTPGNQNQNYGDNVNVRQESVTALNGSLKAYSVIVGTFSVKANAEGLQNRLKGAGYNAVLVQNQAGMYRVAATTFDNKADAVRSRDDFRSQYPDAWLLFAK